VSGVRALREVENYDGVSGLRDSIRWLMDMALSLLLDLIDFSSGVDMMLIARQAARLIC